VEDFSEVYVEGHILTSAISKVRSFEDIQLNGRNK
jgi:hypothetical protein